MTAFFEPATIHAPATPQDQLGSQVVCTVGAKHRRSLSDPAYIAEIMTTAAIQAAIDRAYKSLMRSTTDSERRQWCDRMRFWIARVAR